MNYKHLFAGLAFALFLLAASYAFAGSGPLLPVFYLPDHLDLDSRGLTHELKPKGEGVIYQGTCYIVKRWNSDLREPIPRNTMTLLMQLLDSVPPTTKEWQRCFGEKLVTWGVATYWRGDSRPLYAFINGKVSRTMIGRVKFHTPCERRNLTRSPRNKHYRMTTNAEGLRGVAICERQ